MLVLPVIVCQVAPCLQSRCRVGWDKEKCMLWYYVLVQKEACMSIFTLRVDEYYFLFRPCSERESECQRERERGEGRWMFCSHIWAHNYSMYCVYMYISCTPYQTIIREEGREKERERENVYDREREREEREGESFVYMFVLHVVCTVYTCT